MEEGGGINIAFDGGSTSQRDESLLKCKHIIFLSHSGAQKSFVEQLYLDIKAYDRCPFFDKCRDNLPIGCDFPHLIFEAINQCQVAVVILSKEFFSSSKWPMLELASLVKRKLSDPYLTIMPIFFNITHAQCREKENQYRWLKQWECWSKQDHRIIIEEWQAALKVLGYTNGISMSKADEVKCRQDIIEAICKEVPSQSRRDDSHVQGRLRICKVIREKIQDIRLSKFYRVQILGLYGVGGIGKSTTCMTLCNDYFEEFHGRVCHIEFGVGNELQMLQKILKKFTKFKHELINNFDKDECMDMMKRDIKNQKVFLAIDNVSESYHILEQVSNMLRIGFEQGSILLVTARSLEILQNLDIDENECMEMPKLLKDEALNLFLYHAAPNLCLQTLESKIEEISRLFVKLCRFRKGNGTNYHYHPMALKMLGRHLGNDSKKWIEKFKEFELFNQYREKEDMHPIFSILNRNFETLNDEDQLLFMDAAVFYPKQYLERRINIFEWISIVHGKSIDAIMTMLKGLKRKSLLEDLGDGSKKIGMHDLWREFALVKARGDESHSRRWIYEKVYHDNDPRKEESHLLGGGWKNLQRICIIGEQDFDLDDKKKYIVKEINLDCCSNLRALKLVDIYPETQVLDVRLLKQLKSLEIHYNTNGSNLFHILGLGSLRNLAFLHLDGVQTDSVNEEIGGLTNLHVLDIRRLSSWSTAQKLPDLSKLNSLQNVKFQQCIKAEMISGLNSKMTNIKHLDLGHCRLLRSCHGVGDLVALEKLRIVGCSMLEELPNLRKLINLLNLGISNCKLLRTIPGLDELVSLKHFETSVCSKLVELSDMCKLTNLQYLDLKYCRLLKTIRGLSGLVSLENLEADYGGLEGCNDLCKLTRLERVSIRHLSAQGNLLPSISNLKSLTLSQCGFKDIQFLTNLTSLEDLHISFCDLLESLSDMHKFTRLERLFISECKNLREWKNGSQLKLFGMDLDIAGTPQHLHTLSLRKVAFMELPCLSSYPKLNDLSIVNCEELTSLTSNVPLIALESLSLTRCRNLRALPDLSHLTSLRCFEMTNCGVQWTAHEVEELEALCPMLTLDNFPIQNRDLESDDERDEKRQKLGRGFVRAMRASKLIRSINKLTFMD